ncbi:schwannomin-interacting protein 1 [Denticeps clupeoides]|uniref:schwannomin-interacting protein 1 n=1 Tax=Denticeps clupeoides TaxID=299321 RepID=UPI0010A51D82|nr:schwannomin-interacting protein 1-like [Denticeps clupeoides]XP_028847926.1 schwannomin-interacting protein 1-like [Denticeps clupeoides]
MEGDKERERERGEEKESDETEEDTEGAALEWQDSYHEDDLGLPIMHWEALNLRIAELEKQEEERKQRDKDVGHLLSGWTTDQDPGSHRDTWEDGGDDGNSRLTLLTSRFRNHTNLQLCFINNSESEDEEDAQDTKKEAGAKSGKSAARASATGKTEKPKSTGFRREVKAALSALRNKLWTEQKKKSAPLCRPVAKKLERSELQELSMKELRALHTSLGKDIQDLSSELVGRLLTRDQLRTEQDAMLLEVQDMMSL